MNQYPLILKWMIMGCLSIVPFTAFSQKDYFKLDGEVTVEGDQTYKYQLDLKENNGKLYGYSLTWLEENYPSKAIVVGTIDRRGKQITFEEKEDKNMLVIKPIDICYFNGTLSYHESGEQFILEGKFTGLNKYAQYCGHGEITLFHAVAGDSLLQEVKQKPKNAAHKPAALPAESAPNDVEVITSGSNKELDWHGDTCILDIWDYGTVDGDIVSILFNDKNMLSKYEIVSTKKQLRLPLHTGINTIKIVAENEGKAAPNTARLLLSDGRKQYSFTAYNTIGKSATILLRKKKK